MVLNDQSLVGDGTDSVIKIHLELALRNPLTLSYARARASNLDSINAYFDILEETLEENQLLGKPCQIFNMDETCSASHGNLELFHQSWPLRMFRERSMVFQVKAGSTNSYSTCNEKQFLLYAPPIRPLLLLLDGHSSHTSVLGGC